MLTRRTTLLAGATLLAAPALRQAGAQAPSTWDQIQSTRTLRIGVTAAEPWFYRDPGSSTWSGAATGIGRSWRRR